MKLVYRADISYYQFLILAKYYSLLANPFLNNFIKGFLLKANNLTIIINLHFLYYVIIILKHNSILSLNSLLDLVIVDYPNRLTSRFEIIYTFWNNIFNFRFYIKSFVGALTPILSLSSFYSSLAD